MDGRVRCDSTVLLRFAYVAALVAQLASINACTPEPNVNQLIDQPAPAAAEPRLEGPRGPLTERQSKAILERLQRDAPDTDILGRHLALEESIADNPLTVGNKVTLLRDGAASFAAMFQAIEAAKYHINLEYFIFEDVENAGRHIVDLLIDKRRAGVQVNIIYDSVGSIDTPAEIFDRLKHAGVNLLEFNPINPLEARKEYAINSRDHRKILVVDGDVAVVGGVNISSVYSSHLFSRKSNQPAEAPEYWRDTDLQIEGPAVADLQKLFLESWSKQGGPPLNNADFFPKIGAKGKQVVRIIGSTPDSSLPAYYITLLSAIRNAESRIWITTAYFVPTHQEIEDILAAARRGVNVRLLLPKQSDSDKALYAGRSHYDELLEAGVEIYELDGALLHSKTAVIDSVWSAVGSSNFDRRSVLFNDEVDAIVLGRETAEQLEAMFEDDLKHSDKVDLATWEGRPLLERMQELYSRGWEYWL
jgi:cardiolipin synthase A/B